MGQHVSEPIADAPAAASFVAGTKPARSAAPDAVPATSASGLAAVGTFNTALAEASEALRASEESYRTIFELAGDAMFVHDIDSGAILDANVRACELHGCSLEELKALGVGGISDGTPPFDTLHAAEYIARAAGGEPQRFEWLVRRNSGERFWVEVNLQRVRIRGQDRILASVRNIHERKRAEAVLQEAHAELERRVTERTAALAERTAELAQAEQRFRAIVEASPVPLLLSRMQDGAIRYANDRVERLIGAERGALLGKKTTDFYFDASDRTRLLATIRDQGYVQDMEICIRRADGSPCWVAASVQSLSFDGEPTLATSLIDITERRQAEEALRASEASYRSLFDNLTELVYVQRLDGTFLNVNEAVLRAYGYQRDELIGKTPGFLAAHDRVDIEDTMERFRKAAAGETQRFDWWGRRKDGSVFPKEVVLNRSTYFGQDVVIAVARDVTDRVAAQEMLRRREEHFRMLIENGSDIIAVVDRTGRISYASPSTERILGYRPDERIGRRSDELLHPDDAQELRKTYQRLKESTSRSERFEYRFQHKDGTERVLEGIVRAMPDGVDASGAIVNARDITLRKRAEETLAFQKTLLEAQGDSLMDGMLVVSPEGEVLSHNRRFVELFGIDSRDMSSRSDQVLLESALEKIQDPQGFMARVEYLYAHPQESARDEIQLRDGRVLDRYSAPVVSVGGTYYGRIWFFRDVTDEKRYAEELDAARREAEVERERARDLAGRLQREIEIGQKIQQGFLPAELPRLPGWEIAVRFRPAWQVAGDFYDVFQLAGGRLGIVIADVCGKGVGAALFMAIFQCLLRAYAERAATGSGGAVRAPEDVLLDSVVATNGYTTKVHRPANVFSSVFFGILEPDSGILHYVNAGHEPPVIIGPSRRPVRLVPTGPAIGLVRGARFRSGRTVISPGDLLVALTDGVTEARNSDREFFGEQRYLDLLRTRPRSAAAALDRIDEAVLEFAAGADQQDDVTMIALHRGNV